MAHGAHSESSGQGQTESVVEMRSRISDFDHEAGQLLQCGQQNENARAVIQSRHKASV